jgi:oxalate decarboxylase/phosphoglucose isomerase-like protein (cupin superfamily)
MDNASFTIFDCHIIKLPRSQSRTGNITVVENGPGMPFVIQRIYYLYDIPSGESRGAHSHKTMEQLIVAASGSFDITLDDSRSKKTVRPGIWRDIANFSSGAICLVLASSLYNENDYIRDYQAFKQFKKI